MVDEIISKPPIRPLLFLVDDEPVLVKALMKLLDREGYSVQYSNSGQEALKLIPNVNPDLILLDVSLPDIDGFEVCKILKLQKKTQSIPIIFITGGNEVENIVRGFKLGAHDYVLKPFIKEEFLARISTQLRLDSAIKKQIKDQRVEVMRKMAFTYIHEVLNPLSIASGYLSMLNIEDPEVRDKVKKIETALERIQAIIRQLKDIEDETYLIPKEGEVYIEKKDKNQAS